MSNQIFTANTIQARECLAQMSLLRVDMRLTIKKTRETIYETREATARANDIMGEQSRAAIDPNECRANAARCIEMAGLASGDVSTQNTLFDLAKTWTVLADQMARRPLRGGSRSPSAWRGLEAKSPARWCGFAWEG